MTEAEWLACEAPGEMIDCLNDRLHAKKKGLRAATKNLARRKRLFCCGACRLVWDSITEDAGQLAVEVAERFADAEANDQERAEAEEAVGQLGGSAALAAAFWAVWVDRRGNHTSGASYCYRLVADALEDQTLKDRNARRRVRAKEKAHAAALLQLSGLIRDIFGNPFRPIVSPKTLRTSTAVLLAKQMYESRDFSAMPILADALQDAGSTNDDILNHCRDEKLNHVRGCWVVDLVLGKE